MQQIFGKANNVPCAGSAITSGIASGVENIQQVQKDMRAGETIKSNGRLTKLLQEALGTSAESEAYQLASEMSERVEVALTESGLDAAEIYHMSKADQLKLIDYVVNETLTSREVGKLARILSGMQ